jgi:hypothetical protein
VIAESNEQKAKIVFQTNGRDKNGCYSQPLQDSAEVERALLSRVLFIGTEFSILYTSVYPPAGAAFSL